MAATLSSYNPQLYANRALPLLYKNLGLARRVYRDLDPQRARAGKGEYINIRRPGTFTVQDAPATAEDVEAENVQLQLAYWREVKWKLTDKELALSDEAIVQEHIEPSMQVLAEDIDDKLQALIPECGRRATDFTTGSSAAVNYTNVRKALRDAKVPIDDPGRISYMIDPTMEAHYLSDSGFTQHQGAGLEGVEAQRRGSLGVKFGMETFVTHNTKSHTGGTGADLAGAVDGTFAKHATSITIDGLTNGETFLKGDSFTIDGDTTVYAITDTTLTVASGEITANIEPPLRAAPADGAAVTFNATSDYTSMGFAFHRNALALGMAGLSQMGNELGAQIGYAQDPNTGLALRARKFYVGDTSTVYFAFDVLYGVKTLDGRFGVRHGRA